MSWQSPRIERADIERLMREFETKLSRMARVAAASPAGASRKADGFGDMIATTLSDIADRFGGRARHVDVAGFTDDALRVGNEALRKLTREVERRPLVTLAVAVGVGALAFGLLVRAAK